MLSHPAGILHRERIDGPNLSEADSSLPTLLELTLNPIPERELISIFRTRRAWFAQILVAATTVLLTVLRWPQDATVDLAGVRARENFAVLGYALLASVILLVPALPAASIARERQQRTLLLLLHSPLSATGIYLGKLLATIGFALVLLLVSTPAAGACFAMSGVSLTRQIIPLYLVLGLLALQMGAVGLWISSRAKTPETALRGTYCCVLALVFATIFPDWFLQGSDGMLARPAACLRFFSPIPAVLEVLGKRDVGAWRGFGAASAPGYYACCTMLSVTVLAVLTIRRLNLRVFDVPRDQGVLTEDRSGGQRALRRLAFLVDPQRRKSPIAAWVNPVMVKEFRTRPFGRLHWLLRLVAGCAVISLALTWVTTLGSADWGVDRVGAIIVAMQVGLIAFLTPGLAAGIVSSEVESGGWTLLRMTPLTSGEILRGKLLSVCWTMLLVLCATLPGYLVMVWINPLIREQVRQVVLCLALTAMFSVSLSMAVSSFIRQTSVATATAYALLATIYLGPLLVWLSRDNPFGHQTVENALVISPVGAALSILRTPGFESFELVPANWWITSVACLVFLGIAAVRIRQLLKPD